MYYNRKFPINFLKSIYFIKKSVLNCPYTETYQFYRSYSITHICTSATCRSYPIALTISEIAVFNLMVGMFCWEVNKKDKLIKDKLLMKCNQSPSN